MAIKDQITGAVTSKATTAAKESAAGSWIDKLFGKRDVSAGRYTFEFDAKSPVGFVASLDGGNFKADAITLSQGDELSSTRVPGLPKFEDITIQIGAGMAPAFWDWINATLQKKPERRSGALVGYDQRSKEVARREFAGAVISEIGFPGLDGASKSNAYFTVKIAPEDLKYKKGDDSKLIFQSGKDELTIQKKWLVQNFGFSLERFKADKTMTTVKVDAFSVKQNVIENRVGHQREPMREFGRIELPTLQVTVAETHMAKWMEWWDESVRLGNYTKPTTGELRYLGPDTNEELMRLDFDGVRLLALETTKFEPGKEAIATLRATLSIDKMTLVPGKGATAAGKIWNAVKSAMGGGGAGGAFNSLTGGGLPGAGGVGVNDLKGAANNPQGAAQGLGNKAGNSLIEKAVDEGKKKL